VLSTGVDVELLPEFGVVFSEIVAKFAEIFSVLSI
jgi:hypothetical protein